MMPTPSHLTTISIIGHTNVGKTSLLRTLLRDSDFGEVKNASATTRHVIAVDILSKDNVPLITLHDTPGLEDATGVMDFLQNHTDGRADGMERLSAFLQAVHHNDARLEGDFSQEVKVIKSLLEADIALYIIDAREPVLGKYKDELAILAGSGTPILPVFNFINAPIIICRLGEKYCHGVRYMWSIPLIRLLLTLKMKWRYGQILAYCPTMIKISKSSSKNAAIHGMS